MLGAMLGDIIGSPYEFNTGNKETDFPLFINKSRFTDDTVMTFAVCNALLASPLNADDKTIKANLIKAMQGWGQVFPNAGYGGTFIKWLFAENPVAYNSFGNGSAMRVSSVGWLYDDIARTRHVARLTAEVSHNHPEGVKGAESVASAIFLARNGKTKEEIKEYIEKEFNYNLNRTCDEISPYYSFDVTCQGSVPESIRCFLEGKNYEDTVRLAVSLGGDTDTMGAISGSIAESYWGIPQELKEKASEYMTQNMKDLLDIFNSNKKEVKERE